MADGYTGDYTLQNGPDGRSRRTFQVKIALFFHDDRRDHITEDTVINTVGECSTDGTCEHHQNPKKHASDLPGEHGLYDGTYGSVNLNGSFADGVALASPWTMRMEMASTLEVELPLDTVEYKFTMAGQTKRTSLRESCTLPLMASPTGLDGDRCPNVGRRVLEQLRKRLW